MKMEEKLRLFLFEHDFHISLSVGSEKAIIIIAPNQEIAEQMIVRGYNAYVKAVKEESYQVDVLRGLIADGRSKTTAYVNAEKSYDAVVREKKKYEAFSSFFVRRLVEYIMNRKTMAAPVRIKIKSYPLTSGHMIRIQGARTWLYRGEKLPDDGSNC